MSDATTTGEGEGDASPGASVRTRAAAVVALVVAVAVVVLVTRGDGAYVLHLKLQNASQLVKGNLVEVGGLKVGTVDEIRLDDENLADVRISIADRSLLPLHAGTRAVVRSGSVSGVANRYVALEPGPNSAPRLDDGGTIPVADTTASTDLDAVLSTLDADTRQKLQGTIQGSDAALARGGAAGMNASLRYLDPALTQIQGTLGELVADRSALQHFLVSSAGVVSAVADRRDDLSRGLASAATTAGALAADRRALTAVLHRAPGSLTVAGTTLRSLASTLDAVRPAAEAARPVAPRLSRVLALAAPALTRTAAVLPKVRRLLGPLRATLAGLPALRTVAIPAFVAAATAIRTALPIISAARAAGPDLVLGATNGFGGTSGGSYDANGEYARIGFVSTSTPVVGTLGNILSTGPGQDGITWHNVSRCPGGAGVLAADGSNAFDPGYPCDAKQRR